MKAQSTMRKHIRQLREIVDNSTDPAERRMAYLGECLLRWASETTVGWESPAAMVSENARLLRDELKKETP